MSRKLTQSQIDKINEWNKTNHPYISPESIQDAMDWTPDSFSDENIKLIFDDLLNKETDSETIKELEWSSKYDNFLGNKPQIKKIAVIEVDMDYGHLNGLEYVQSFATIEEAQDFVRSIKSEEQAINVKFIKYVDEYVEKIEIPEWHVGMNWANFTNDYPGCDVSPERFKEKVKYTLRSGSGCKKPDFTPPPRTGYRHLEIVEMKE